MNDIDFYREAKFVSDSPAEKDEFPTRAHERVAKTLVAIIREGEGGRAIGLEGTWGSGKSTVIDFALAEFKKENANSQLKHSVFVFDAWAHQGDPLRRVFLEELISKLAVEVLDQEKWKRELDRLQSKKKKTTETRAEKLSWVARTALLTLPLYPLAYGLISAYFAKPAAPPPPAPTSALETMPLGALVTLALLVIFAPYAVAVVTKLLWLRDPEKKDKSVIWAFTKQTDHVTTEQLIREDEATSVEFNAVFDRLVDDAKFKNHQLVIVLDNLDRLANDQIREVWATMRNFFAATPGSRRRKSLRSVWLIVPIDRHHIEAVFADGVATNSETATTRGFIEKTFEFVLRVPPPLLSNWRSFLEQMLKRSFAEKISNDETYRIFRLFEVFHAVRPIIITPRAIKAYVNRVVAQAKLSGDLIPLEFQSLFVLYQEEIAKDLKKLQDSTLLDSAVAAAVSDPSWTKYLAAAHFNARPEDALEILLAPEIEKGILERNADRLIELKNTGGFENVMHNLVTSKSGEWARENGTNFLEIAATLDKVVLEGVAASNHIWRDFGANTPKIEKPIVPSPSAKEGIAALIRRPGDHRLASWLKTILEMPRSEFPEGGEEAGRSWLAILNSLLLPLQQKVNDQIFAAFVETIKLNGDIFYLFGVAEALHDDRVLTLKNFSFDHSPDSVSNAIVAEIQAPVPPAHLEKVFAAFLQLQKSVKWPPVVEAIQARLRQNTPPVNASIGVRLFGLLRALGPSALAQEARASLLRDGSLHGIMEIGRNEKNDELVALIVYEATLFQGAQVAAPAEHPHYGALASANEFLANLQSNPSSEPVLVEKIASLALQAATSATVLTLALPQDKAKEFYRAVFRKMLEIPNAKNIIVTDMLQKFERVDAIVGKDLRQNLFKALDRMNLLSDLADEKWRAIDPSFLEAAHEAKSKQLSLVEAAIGVGLSKLSQDQWAEILNSEGNELALILKLIQLRKYASLGPMFFDAIRSYAERMVDGTNHPSKFTAEWSELPGQLSIVQKGPFYKSLRDLLLTKIPRPEIIVRVFLAFGQPFADHADFAARKDDVIRTIIEPLMADTQDASLDCLLDYSKAFKEAVRGARAEERQFLADRLSAVFSGATEARRERLRTIGEALGLEFGDKSLGAEEKPDDKA